MGWEGKGGMSPTLSGQNFFFSCQVQIWKRDEEPLSNNEGGPFGKGPPMFSSRVSGQQDLSSQQSKRAPQHNCEEASGPGPPPP